ncbi:RNA polymerase sigma factor [Tautonia rosea]|uniref:RNA polymerase sigma factor n=1 Tax=Tautonia rosea TaxID=2728037 RepID=UPI001473DE29|nr:sigma-70 family RNA polymerase sigma factor [Tautonia rosea]
MAIADCGKTDRGLIGKVADWRDASAWGRFDATYRPMVRSWGRRFGFEGDDLEELCQVVMIWLSRKITSFRDEPTRTFRAWLRCVVSSRAIDLLRARRRALPNIDPDVMVDERPLPPLDSTRCSKTDPVRSVPAEVLQTVQRRVQPESWRIFWMVRVEGMSVDEVRHLFGKTYAATYRNQERVARMLRAEMERFQSTDA